MIKKILPLFIIMLISMSAQTDPVESDCPPEPYFVECPGDEQGRVAACIFDTVYLQVKAFHSNADSAKAIRYHIEEGPGQVDEKTGLWSYFYEEGDPVNFNVEISASIGLSGHRTEGENNCRFKVYLGGGRIPYILIDSYPYTRIFKVKAPGIIKLPLEVPDRYNCGYTLEIFSVTPPADGPVFIDDKENLVFKPTTADKNEKFIVELRATNYVDTCFAKAIFDTREEIPAPEFTVCPGPNLVTNISGISEIIKAVDPENGDDLGMIYEIVSGPGRINNNRNLFDSRWSFYPTVEDTGKTYEVEIAATYGDVTTTGEQNCRFSVTVLGSSPPDFGSYENNPCGKVIDVPETGIYKIEYRIIDDLQLHFFLADYPEDLSGRIELDSDDNTKNNGWIVINLGAIDRDKSYDITLGATNFVDTSYCDFTVHVIKDFYSFKIEKIHQNVPGEFVDVNVFGHTPVGIGGFDFLIGYNADALTFLGANTNSSRLFNECGWEYFEYRFGPFGEIDSTVPSGMLRVVGMAETNNGNYHPSCFTLEDDSVMFTLKFLVSEDEQYDCTFQPIRFFWYDCGDNNISNQIGTELYIAEKVYDYVDGENWDLLTPEDVNTIEFPTYEGAMESCVSPAGNNWPEVSRYINFYNGGVDIICNNWPDTRGDLNLDGLAYTIADAVLYKEYFVHGLSVFDYPDSSTVQSDVNFDDIPLTVEDFVYMIRVIVGDLSPYGDTVYTCEDTAKFSLNDGTLTVDFDSADSLGAVYLKVQGEVTPVLEAVDMDMDFHYANAYTNIIIYSFDVGNSIYSGPLVSGIGNNPLVEAATATYMGAKVICEIDNAPLDDFYLRIGTYEKVELGHYQHVNVYMNADVELGGFDFLIGYDNSALTFTGISKDSSALYNNCAWEYFSYRAGPFSGCDSTCPSGLVRVVGLAEVNIGDIHPSCYNIDGENILFTLNFLATNDRTYECKFTPVRFFWIDCGDNIVSSRTGTELYVSDKVFDVSENGNWLLLTPDDRSTIEFPTNEGAADSCLSSGGVNNQTVSRHINFYNGGINLNDGCSIDWRGDLNLDGVAYTIADAVLYKEYFIHGLSVFEYPDSSTVQSDVNKDGIPLTVEDMEYLVMVVIGEALPYSQLEPCNDTAGFSQNSGTVTVDFDSADSLGVVYLKVQGEVSPVLEAPGMDMDYHYDSTYTNIIIYSFDAGNSIHGELLVSGIGDNPLVEAATATYYGAKVTAVLDYVLDVDNTTGNLPDDFYLGINYPNPFNPTTTFDYNLPYACEVELTVYNIRGQTVRTLVNQTMPSGRHTAVWHGVDSDGQPVASGVYFYRIKTDKFVATKKMLLMK